MDEADLPILHHSFFYEPPLRFPGYRDIWGNLAIALRAAAHPWGAQRLLAYVILSGMLDRYPRLRIGFAERSAGWLAGWLNRLETQADYLAGHAAGDEDAADRDTPAPERVFCGVELDEGETMTQSVIDVVGDGVLHVLLRLPARRLPLPELAGDRRRLDRAWRDNTQEDLQRERRALPAARLTAARARSTQTGLERHMFRGEATHVVSLL